MLRSSTLFAATLGTFLAIMAVAVVPLWGQPVGETPGTGIGSLFGNSLQGPNKVVSVSAWLSPPADGKPARLSVTATMQPGWHIYSLTQPPGGPRATAIKLEPSSAYRLAGAFQPNVPPEKKQEPVFDNLMVESHHGSITWEAPLEIAPGVDPATLKITGAVNAQPCDVKSCLPPQDFAFVATLKDSRGGPPPDASVVPVPKGAPPGDIFAPPAAEPLPQGNIARLDLDHLEISANERLRATPLWLAAGMGFLGGLILNVMPCVLPVIGLKILSFVEQAGHSRRRAMELNIWYSLGLVAVFMVLATLAVFARYSIGEIFQLAGFQITLAAVVFAMALSFLGVWEVPIPGFVGSGKAAEWGQKEGAAGAFSKGVLTTILATPCIGPFWGSALAWSVAQTPARAYAVFASAGLGMASPYLLLGAVPELLRFVPRPGAWMETFKQIMGFVLLGTVVYLLTFFRWADVVPTVGLLFGLWAACWWIGRIPATATFDAKTRGWLGAAAFAAVVWIVMFPGIDGVVSGRFAFGGLREAMQSRLDGTGWRPYSRAALEESVASGKSVLIDFTADWCLTCKTLEAQVLNTAPVSQAIEAAGVVTMKADWTHGDPEVTAMLDTLGSKQVPVIAIFPAADPNRPIVLRDGYTQASLLDALKTAGASKRSDR
jgi:thiol:disulfide interchange protein DsbD